MMYSCLMVKISFPEWLAGQLRSKNLRQQDIADRSGLTAATISRLLSGERQPGIDSLVAIAKALRVPREEVFKAAGVLNSQSQSLSDI